MTTEDAPLEDRQQQEQAHHSADSRGDNSGGSPQKGSAAGHPAANYARSADKPFLAEAADRSAEPDTGSRPSSSPNSPAPETTSERRSVRHIFASRPLKVPLILLGLTIASTFWVGAAQWVSPMIFMRCVGKTAEGEYILNLMPIRSALVTHWGDGLIYCACVLGILLTHEMGHFLATVRYGIPATLPFCIPLPISPIGTMGAVIAMDGRRADRREMFDIGLAGPLAGLVVAVPIMWIGIGQLDLNDPVPAVYSLESPLAVSLALDRVQPPGYEPGQPIPNTQLNPYFMAGWVGLLITGLNMLPVSQLDGGHVIYALLGKKAHWFARAFMVAAIAYVVWDWDGDPLQPPVWSLMIVLVLLLGTDHPPTRNDRARLGWFRVLLGAASLAIPVLCFSPKALSIGL